MAWHMLHLESSSSASALSREPKRSQLCKRSQYAHIPNYASLNHPKDPNPQQYTTAGKAKQWEKDKLRLYTFCVMKKRRKMGGGR